MAAKLKLFAARQGFFDTVVAAPSRKAALDAWGVRQDLFKEGLAVETDEPAARVALEHPGVVLRRMAGSAGAYAETAEVDASALPAPSSRPRAGKPAPKATPPPPPPDRSALTAAERALKAAETVFAAERADLDARRRALEADEATLDRHQARRRRELKAALDKAAEAFRRAGGTP